MGKNEAANLFGRADEVALAAEALFKLLAETFEEVDMLRLFAGKPEQRPNSVVVPRELRSGVIHHVGQNKLFNQAEHCEIFVAANLIQSALLFRGEKRKLLYLCQ